MSRYTNNHAVADVIIAAAGVHRPTADIQEQRWIEDVYFFADMLADPKDGDNLLGWMARVARGPKS